MSPNDRTRQKRTVVPTPNCPHRAIKRKGRVAHGRAIVEEYCDACRRTLRTYSARDLEVTADAN